MAQLFAYSRECTEKNMLETWSLDFQTHPAIKMEASEADEHAKTMLKSLNKAGLTFDRLKRDFQKHPDYCPINRGSNQDWLTILDRYSRLTSHALAMSVVKYFKSKSLTTEQVEEEERSRIKWSDKTCLFLKYPITRGFKRNRPMVKFIKNVFPKCLVVSPGSSSIKILFADNSHKIEAMSGENVWPDSHELMEFLDPERFNLDSQLSGEVVKTELVIPNFFTKSDDATLFEELKEIFPHMLTYEYVSNKVILRFNRPADAMESFLMYAKVKIGDYIFSTIFNRRPAYRASDSQLHSAKNDDSGSHKRRRASSKF